MDEDTNEKVDLKNWMKSMLATNMPIFEQIVVSKFIQTYGHLTPESFHHARLFIHNFCFCYGYKIFLQQLLRTIDEDDDEPSPDIEVDQFVLQLALQYSNYTSIESQRDALKSLFELIVKD